MPSDVKEHEKIEQSRDVAMDFKYEMEALCPGMCLLEPDTEDATIMHLTTLTEPEADDAEEIQHDAKQEEKKKQITITRRRQP